MSEAGERGMLCRVGIPGLIHQDLLGRLALESWYIPTSCPRHSAQPQVYQAGCFLHSLTYGYIFVGWRDGKLARTLGDQGRQQMLCAWEARQCQAMVLRIT